MKIYKNRIVFCGVFLFSLLAVCSPVRAGKSRGTSGQYWPTGPEIVSASGIVVEADTGTILYEKDSLAAQYPASITKILTTLLAVENSSMDEIVTFSYDSVHKTEGSGIARDVDEQMTMEQCLYGVMLASSNECAYAVAEHVGGGDINTFIQMMNDRAIRLGCQNTHFTNCNGLPDEQHYTCAYDMALIAMEAYKNETFRIICGTKTYTIPFTNKHTDEETYLQNHHQMLYPYRTRKYLYDYCLGGKTGYTTAANNTLVTYAEKDGMTLICVVMNAPSGHYDDTRALFDFCFDNFKEVNVLENETSFVQQNPDGKGVLGSYEPFVSLDPSSEIVLPITAEFSDVASETVYGESGSGILGSIYYTYADRAVGKADITATNAVVDTFEFQDEDDTEVQVPADDGEDGKSENEAEFREDISVDVKMIFLIILGVVGLAAVIWLGFKFVDNFYNLKRKLHIGRKDKSPYKTIRKNKMWKSHKKWFK